MTLLRRRKISPRHPTVTVPPGEETGVVTERCFDSPAEEFAYHLRRAMGHLG